MTCSLAQLSSGCVTEADSGRFPGPVFFTKEKWEISDERMKWIFLMLTFVKKNCAVLQLS